MKRQTSVWLAVLTIGASLSALSSVALAAAKDANGTWTWTFSRPNNVDVKIEMTLKLKQEGDKLTGTLKGPQGGEIEIKDGSVKDGEVKFKVDRERNGNVVSTLYSGKLDGDTIKGKSETEFSGQKRERDWEAKRKP
jgi:hypothetical protein